MVPLFYEREARVYRGLGAEDEACAARGRRSSSPRGAWCGVRRRSTMCPRCAATSGTDDPPTAELKGSGTQAAEPRAVPRPRNDPDPRHRATPSRSPRPGHAVVRRQPSVLFIWLRSSCRYARTGGLGGGGERPRGLPGARGAFHVIIMFRSTASCATPSPTRAGRSDRSRVQLGPRDEQAWFVSDSRRR